ISPELSVITNIGFDHMQILGDTLDKIAFEKAGIIKKETPVVIGEYLPETLPVFKEKAEQEHSPIYFAQDIFKTEFIEGHSSTILVKVDKGNESDNLELDLTGLYQLKNIKTVLAA